MQKNRNRIIKWLPLLATAISVVIIVLDGTVLNVSVNEIRADLHMSSQTFQWIITSYSLVLASLTVTGGRLGDMFGRKKMFLTGAILFGIGSLVASFAQSQMQLLLGWSILEGMGAALMMPAGSALLVSNYKGADRAKAFAIYGGLAGISAALGPIFGGFITENFTWHWALRINVVVVALLVLASRFIIETRDTQHKNELDIMGVLLTASGLGLVSYGFVQATTYGWFLHKASPNLFDHTITLPFGLSAAFGLILVGTLLLSLFVHQQHRRTKHSHSPLLDLTLFKNRQFTSGAIIMSLLALVQGGFVLVLPLLFGATKQYDAFHQGLAIVPYSIGFFTAAILSMQLAKRLKPKKVIQTGAIVSLSGYLLFALTINANTSAATVALPLLIMGLGGGLMVSLISNLTLSAVDPSEAGQASGVFSTFRNMGGTLGNAVVGAVLLSGIVSFVPAKLLSVSLPKDVISSIQNQAKEKSGLNKTVVTNAVQNAEGINLQDKQRYTADALRAMDTGYAQAARRSLLIAAALVATALAATVYLPDSVRGTGHKSEQPTAAH